MAQPITLDVQRLIAEVAVQHRLVLKPDDPAFALVTINRVVLEESMDALHRRIQKDLEAFEAAAAKLHQRAGSMLAAQVRESSAEIRQEIQRDIDDASIKASKIVQHVARTCQQPLSHQRFIIVVLAAVLLFVGAAWVGRMSTLWWPL